MKKFLLSLATLLTLGMASASAETLYEVDFANLAPKQGSYSTGGIWLYSSTSNGIAITYSGINPQTGDNIGRIGKSGGNSDPAYVYNTNPFENGAEINQIVINAIRFTNTTDQVEYAKLQLLTSADSTDPIATYDFTNEVNNLVYNVSTPITINISEPQDNLIYKVLFSTPTVTSQGWLGISTIQYNSASGEVTPPVTEAVATPTFSPAAGAVEAGTQVTISCTTEDATIYYTTNGDEPTADSTEYTTAITVNEAMTIKAIAVKEGMDNSAIAEAAYTIKPAIEVGENQALFNFSSASWLTANEIALPTAGEPTVVTNEAYTQNPITVTFSDPQNYASSNASVINESGAYLLLIDSYFGFKVSANDNYYITNVKFDYAKTNQLILDQSSSGNFEDGVWTPKQEGDEVQELTFYPFQNCSINYFIVTYAQAEGEIQVAAPVFEPAAGEVESGTEVIITCETEDATIYYTTDGTDPSADSTEYTEAFTITEDITIKAIAVKEGCTDSEIVTAEYTVKTGGSSEDTLLEATFNFTDGEWLTAQGITLPASGSNSQLDDNKEFTALDATLTVINEYYEVWDDVTAPSIGNNDGAYIFNATGYSDLKFTVGKDCYLSSIELDLASNGWIMAIEGGGNYSDGTWVAGNNTTDLVELYLMDDVTIKTITVKYTKSVGVDNINVDADAAPVYYNLQGVRVANPEKGVYIVVKGNKATKVIF